MKSKDARALIFRLLRDELDVPPDIALVLAGKIYADVVATAVDDERENWVSTLARDPRFDN